MLNDRNRIAEIQQEKIRRPGCHITDGEGGCLAYGNVFELTPESVPYRPERTTAIPTVGGLQTAIVTGPAGVPSYADELGRVKVQFPWDREGGSDENSFCWVRVSQPPGVDEAFIPEVGDEVVVGFFEGDPSRPVIVGRLFNGQDLPPAR